MKLGEPCGSHRRIFPRNSMVIYPVAESIARDRLSVVIMLARNPSSNPPGRYHQSRTAGAFVKTGARRHQGVRKLDWQHPKTRTGLRKGRPTVFLGESGYWSKMRVSRFGISFIVRSGSVDPGAIWRDCGHCRWFLTHDIIKL